MAINSAYTYTSFLNNNLVSQDWTGIMNQLASGGLNMSALTSVSPTQAYSLQAYQAAAALSSLSQLQSGWGSMLGGSSYGSLDSAYGALGSFGSSLGSLGSSLSSFGSPYSSFGSSYGSQLNAFNPYGSYGQQQAPPPPPPPHHHHHQGQNQGQVQNCNNGQSWNNGGGRGWGASGMFGTNGSWPQSNSWDPSCQNNSSADQCQNNGNTYGNGGAQTGTLTQDGGDGSPITYETSGGWTIAIDGTTTTFTDPDGKQTVQYSGDPHEYVNGEHVKDWEDKQRTLELPDGTKVTLSATAANGTTTATSIYDGNTAYQIDNTSNTVTSTTTGSEALQREQAQYDGETAQLTYNNSGGLNYTNLYTQNEDFSTTSNYGDIASTTLASDGTVSVKDNYAAS